MEVILAVILQIVLVVLLSREYNNLNFAAEHHVEAVATGRFFETREASPITPLVQFPTKGIGFDLDHAEFTSSN